MFNSSLSSFTFLFQQAHAADHAAAYPSRFHTLTGLVRTLIANFF